MLPCAHAPSAPARCFNFGSAKSPNIVRSPERKEADARRLALLRTPALPPRPAGNPEKTGAQVSEGERATRQATG
jgi:hypothetical protein